MVRLGNGGVIVNISASRGPATSGRRITRPAKAGVAQRWRVGGQANWPATASASGCVAPGFVHTPMVEAMKPEALAKIDRADSARSRPGRDHEEIAHASRLHL